MPLVIFPAMATSRVTANRAQRGLSEFFSGGAGYVVVVEILRVNGQGEGIVMDPTDFTQGGQVRLKSGNAKLSANYDKYFSGVMGEQF
jgi:hypothetical protein